MKYLFIVFCSQILALVSADACNEAFQKVQAKMPASGLTGETMPAFCADNKALLDDIVTKCTATDGASKAYANSVKRYLAACKSAKEMKTKFCDQLPIELMKIAEGQAVKKKCKALQAECMGKAEGEKDTCWNAKIKQLMDETDAKFCDDLPADMIQKCKEAKGKCAAKSGDEKDDCRTLMEGGIREKMKANFCDRVPAEMKQKCMAAKAACSKRPDSGRGSGVGKDGKSSGDGKGMGGMGGNGCWEGKIRAMIGMIGKGKDGSGSGDDKKDGAMCDVGLQTMKAMMKDVKDPKKISDAMKMTICKAYMTMDKDMMKKMMMCKSKELKDAMGMVKRLCGNGSGSGDGKKDGSMCDTGLKSMKAMMKDVKNVKEISDARKMAVCKAYMTMDKDMMKKMMMMCKSKELQDKMGMAKQLCGNGSGIGDGKKDGSMCDTGLKSMKAMMQNVKDPKKISGAIKMAICKAYMVMDKDMMKKMMMCKSKELQDKMGMAKQLCGGDKRKPRKIAEKGSNCAAIPEKAKLSKDNCVTLKMSLIACANKDGLADKIKKCAQLRNLKTKQIKRKLVKFAQKVKGIDFGKDDEATKKKKAKYEKAVLKLYKAISGVFTYTKDTSRMRRKLATGATYTVSADLTTDTDTEADGASAVDAAAVSAELKKDVDFEDVEVEAASVKLEEVDVEEIVEEVATTTVAAGGDATDAPVDAAASTTTAFVLGLVSMMAF